MSRTIKGSRRKDLSLNGKRGRGFPWESDHSAFTKKAISKTERRKNKVKPQDFESND